MKNNRPTSDSRVGIIIQARMGSIRLPGKVMLRFGNTSLLGWILERLSVLPWPVVVATTTQEKDLAIVQFCQERGVDYFRGSEHDVLARYQLCSVARGFEHVVRLTADNPFPDIRELQRLIELHLQGGFDYSHSFGELPVGVGAEIFSASALAKSFTCGAKSRHREHVNEYIQENMGNFYIGKLQVSSSGCKDLGALTIDTPEDYKRICSYLPRDALPSIQVRELG